jgi:uncharacterized membrane protein YdcZ (DUF606 family)
MPPSVVALMFSAGFATWVYTKIQRKTGGNTQNSLVVSAIAFIFGFVFMLLVLGFVEDYLG